MKRQYYGTAAFVILALVFVARMLIDQQRLIDVMVPPVETWQNDPDLGYRQQNPTVHKILLSDSQPGKPFIVLHYGPAKTGTTTLQTEMTAWKDRIYDLDNFLYGGVFYDANMTWLGRLESQKAILDIGFQCNMEMIRVRTKWEVMLPEKRPPLRDAIRNIPCVQDLRLLLEPYRNNHTSLLFSNEVKSTASNMRQGIPGYYGKRITQDWISLTAALGDEWNFLLVIGYRPYLDWVASAKSQNEKYNPSKPALRNWPDKGGRQLFPLFPESTLLDSMETLWDVDDSVLRPRDVSADSDLKNELRRQFRLSTNPFQSTKIVYDACKDYIPIRFLHLYDEIPVRTNLLCHILPNTPHSCQASREEDRKNGREIAHINQGFAVADRSWYDQFAVEAVTQKLLPSSVVSRARLTEKLMWHHEHTLNRTKWDLPHQCPHREAVLAAWDISWQDELDIFGEKHANLTRHIQVFRQLLARGKHCNIDAKRAVQQEEWRNFIRQIASSGGD